LNDYFLDIYLFYKNYYLKGNELKRPCFFEVVFIYCFHINKPGFLRVSNGKMKTMRIQKKIIWTC